MSDFPLSYYFSFLLSQLFPSKVEALTSAPLEPQNVGHPARKPAQGSCLASGPHRLVGSAGSGIPISNETLIPLGV